MLAKTFSAAVIGIDAFAVEVEVSASFKGEQNFVSIVGLPDVAVKESRDRVRAALDNSGLKLPRGATLVNLAPGDLKKEGTVFDLSIALGLLAAQGVLDGNKLARLAAMGELALNGALRPVKGVLPVAALCRKRCDLEGLIVPLDNAEEAALAAGDFPVYGVRNLSEVVNFLRQEIVLEPYRIKPQNITENSSLLKLDFADVKGQVKAKRAMEIAAAGGHNSLMIGPPGTGKSMIAKRLPGILPAMTFAETLEASRIYSVLGLLSRGNYLLRQRPFRSPHHTISDVGLIGGGKNPRPGEISLAHRGVLFLDELPEFKRNVLEVLRQPLENGIINVARAAGSYTFPAEFILIAAMNPCPCGLQRPELGCRCRPDEKERYFRKISGPLLDRIDLHVEVPQLTPDELQAAPQGEASFVIAKRVTLARERQKLRFGQDGVVCNAAMSSRDLQKYCVIDRKSQLMLRQAINNLKLSPRAYDRILKVARTVADLALSEKISEAHLFEAISYRSLEHFRR